MTTPPLPVDRILPGVALMLLFCAVGPLIDVAAKLAAQTVPAGQITAARFLIQALLMAPVVLIAGKTFRLSRADLRLTLIRAGFLLLSTFSIVSALKVMPIADALAIVFVEPFIILLFGWLVFGESVGPRRIGASAVGFAGALLVIQPSLSAFGWVALWPLATAFSFAAYMLVTRVQSRRMDPVPMQFHTAWVGAALSLPILVLANGTGLPDLDPIMPEGISWLWLASVGVAATASHMAITYALTFAPSSTLAPLHYLELVAGVILGYLVFSDFPSPLTWAGIALIAGSGLYVIHRERVNARSRRITPQPDAPEPL